LVASLDVIFHYEFVDSLVELAASSPRALLVSGSEWSELETLPYAPLSKEILPGASFACFMIDRRLFEIVGEFDEQFAPAYYEDHDMNRRITLAGYETCSSKHALFWHEQSSTVRSLDQVEVADVREWINERLEYNRELYAAKWGGYPGEETFLEPYRERRDSSKQTVD
ncbi:MAG: hypothetical protein KDD42_08995, partial [Bdellovibrionales bacterium]|nr:hypothetical protein [Bdellovibrionales bacterium]